MAVKKLVAGECYYSGLDRATVLDIQRSLTLPNPRYNQALAFSRVPSYAISAIPKTLEFHSEPSPGVICVPRGFRLIPADVEKVTVCKPAAVFPKPALEPRKWQEKAVSEWLKHKKDHFFDGCVIASPGQGKSICGLFLAAALGLRTLIIVHTDQILRTWLSDIKEMFGDAIKPAVIKGAKKQAGDVITIAMIQTLRNMPAEKWAREFGLVLVDECHRAPCLSYYAALKACEAAHKVGLTATLKRTDGLGSLITWTCGPVRVTAEKDEKAVVPLKVIRVKTPFVLHKKDESPNKEFPQSTLWLRQMRLNKRNVMIAWLARFITANSKVKGPCLIVTSRTELCEELQKLLANDGAEYFHAKMDTATRTDFMTRAKAGSVPITIATATMLAEGVNVPIWTHLINTQSYSSPILARQVIGRVERAHASKTKGFVYDLVDDNAIVRKQFAKRFDVYRRVAAEFATLLITTPDNNGECKLLRPAGVSNA